jgi:L-ascorbate metabolism protein UlaG (beta-lactamase superfamily)
METPVGGALLDAYLSRPPFPANGTTEEGLGALRSLLATARPGRIRWIFIGHSHSDHAVDAGAFAAETGAVVVGSATTCFVAQAGGLDPRRCRIVDDGDTLRFGRRVWSSSHPAYALTRDWELRGSPTAAARVRGPTE